MLTAIKRFREGSVVFHWAAGTCISSESSRMLETKPRRFGEGRTARRFSGRRRPFCAPRPCQGVRACRAGAGAGAGASPHLGPAARRLPCGAPKDGQAALTEAGWAKTWPAGDGAAPPEPPAGAPAPKQPLRRGGRGPSGGGPPAGRGRPAPRLAERGFVRRGGGASGRGGPGGGAGAPGGAQVSCGRRAARAGASPGVF